MRKSTRILPALCLAALFALLGGGCATQAMKGTPFFTGEYEGRLGPAEDRVNLWPLFYYRDPALSFLWPIGEYSDTHLALRPLFSMHRWKAGEPYTEFNLAWPFIQFDTRRHEHRIFPVFWNSEDAVVFPLYWHYDRPFAGPAGTDALFPLWIYRRSPGTRSLHLLWPFTRFHDSPREAGWRIWPLAGSRHSKKELGRRTFWLWPLGGSEVAQNRSADWFLPFYSVGTTADSSFFLSLPWYDRRSPDRRTRAVPAVLSWRTDGADGAAALTLLLGLYRDATSADGERRGHLIPLYAYGPHYAISPLYARSTSESGRLDVVPPLLAWRSRDSATGRDSLYLGAGLYHRRRGVEGRDRDWLLPLFLRDEAEGTWMTPLWAHQQKADGTTAWSALPPLLSWRSRDSATGRDSLYLGAGLYHRRRGVEGHDRDWLMPLFYGDEEERLFLSPLYASQRREDGKLDWAVVPPLLALRRDSADGARDTFALGGLARWGRDAEGRGHGRLFPLWSYGPDRFLSLLYAEWLDGKEPGRRRVQAIPPLLSWESRDPATGRGDQFALLGLYHARVGVPEEQRAGHLLPFYAYDRAAGSFLTPLFGHWRSGGTRYAYCATPFAGTFEGEAHGFWVLPLGGRYEDDTKRITQVLWGRNERRADGTGSASFFPVFSHHDYGDAAPLLKAMAAAEAPVGGPTRTLGTETDWLLFLGGSKRIVSGELAAWGHLRKGPTGPPPGSLLLREERASFLFPLWSIEAEREVRFDKSGARQSDRSASNRSLLLWLYDSRRESSPDESHDYVRHRVLWRLLHYERLDGDVSMDVFPAITWDRRVDGTRKFTLLWRLFRNEKDAEGKRKLDILFVPILR